MTSSSLAWTVRDGEAIRFLLNFHSLYSLALLLGFILTPSIVAKEKSAKPKLVLAAAEDFEPYSSRHLPNGGIATEIVRMAFLQAGYEIDVQWVPWPRAMENAKKGVYHGILGAWYTQERAQVFTYSLPVLRNEIVFFKRQGEPIVYNSFKDLKPYRIGVAKGSAPHELLKGELADNLDITNSAFLTVKMLLGKRIDLIADERLSIFYILDKHFPQSRPTIEVLQTPLQINNLYVVISKKIADHQNIVDSYNKGYLRIRSDGLVEVLQKKHGFD